MDNDAYAAVWSGLSPEMRTRLAEGAHTTIDVADARALPGTGDSRLTTFDAYEYPNERVEGTVLNDEFADWIDHHTTEGHYARGWDSLSARERDTIAASETGEASEGTVLRLAQTVGVTGAYWPGFQAGPDRWDVGMGFVEYVRERLARA